MDAAIPLVRNFLKKKFEDLPSEVVQDTKKSILDTLAALIAGTGAPGCPEIVSQILDWRGKEESTILGYGKKVPVHLAALANGTMARAVDFDDVFEPGTAHASASLVPCAMAMGERVGSLSGKEFLTSMALGLDFICRLGKTHKIPPGVSGMNVTYQYAYFAAAAVAGRIMGLNETQMLNALGLAYSQTSGNSQNLLEGTLAIRFGQGLAAQGGVYAAIFAARGITAAQEVFQGKFGYFPVYQRGQYDISQLLQGLGETYEGTKVTRKMHPCCMHTHAAIDAVMRLTRRYSLRVEDIERVVVRVNQNGYNFVCLPPDKIYRPQSVPEAQFSLPYTVATALVKGKVTLEDFTTPAIKNPDILEVASRVECQVDEELTRTTQTQVTPAIVEIQTKGGKSHTLRVNDRKGSPSNPMTMEEVEEKFHRCAEFAIRPPSPENVFKICSSIRRLEEIPNIAELVKWFHGTP
jgi:2-methylcitrate dehydratase PrpD